MATQQKVVKTSFKLRRGLANEWAEANPVLLAGEPAYELDTHKLKIGDGELSYNDLPYIANDDDSDAELELNFATDEDIKELFK